MFYLPYKQRSVISRQRGAALIVALLVFAIASALMVGLQRDFTLQLQRGSNSFLQEQAWVYLEGAENLAAMGLRLDAAQDTTSDSPRDDLTELWAQEATPYPLDEQGWLLGSLEDLEGRFNLNGLVAGETAASDGESSALGTSNPSASNPSASNLGAPKLSVQQKQFIRLLQTLEDVEISVSEARVLTDAVIDFIDQNDAPRPDGAEAEAYRNLTPAYRPSNRPLASVSELRAVKGFTPEIYRALVPWVSVWPSEPSELNIHTAPITLLRTLNTDDQLEPLPLFDAQRLSDLRSAGEFSDLDTFLADPVFSGGVTDELRTILGETSDWFLLRAQVEIAGREQRLYSVLERDGQRVVSRYRSLGEL